MGGDEQVVPLSRGRAREQVVPRGVRGRKGGVVGAAGLSGYAGLQAVPVAAPAGVPVLGLGVPVVYGYGGYGYSYSYGCGYPGPVGPEKARGAGRAEPRLPEVTSGEKVEPRWHTPHRKGCWEERWECAAEMGAKSVVRSARVGRMCEAVRCMVSEEIRKKCESLGVARATVEKWMCLLAEYLELNGDEHVLMAILLSRYRKSRRGWLGENDWYFRPQRWECVVAVAAYLAVLLSEEFPSKVAHDLKELLGRNFKFGKEQLAFLVALGWRVNVNQTEFEKVRQLVDEAAIEIEGKTGEKRIQGPMFAKLTKWFLGEQGSNATPPASRPKVKVCSSPITPEYDSDMAVLGKKRPRDWVGQQPVRDDSVVPCARNVVPRYSLSHAHPAVVPLGED